jgi:diguanylate cyclase (GGDEF)-like protein
MRRLPLFALAAAIALLGLAIGTAVHDREQRRADLDRSLANRAGNEAAALEAYFNRARSVNLLTAHNPGFRHFYDQGGGRAGRGPLHHVHLSESNEALAYLERLYPHSIGEACFIDVGGAENARVVRGIQATLAELSPDESRNPFFAPTFAMRPGQVYQARPYISPDTKEWVISNSTLLPATGRKRAIVHFEVTVESFRRAAFDLAGRDHVDIVDARTGAVVIDSARPQRIGAPLGETADRQFRQAAHRASSGLRTIEGHRTAFRTVTRGRGNANHWIVAVSSPAAEASLLGGLGVWPIGMVLGALLFLFVAIATFRTSQRELRHAAVTDALTGLGNRRLLMADLERALERSTLDFPRLLVLLDLDGFKSYNDTFGHPAGDALLVRLGRHLDAAVAPWGRAYRLGGDEFCVLATASADEAFAVIEAARVALSESGEGFSIGASHGTALLPEEAADAAEALRCADQRMYVAKQGGRPSAERQSTAVLLRALEERHPDLARHLGDTAELAGAVGERMGLDAEALGQLRRAAELHDVGKVAIPESILAKPGPLDDEEWAFMRRHTLIGERILSAAPALEPVARLVRSSHERWDGQGYPDRLPGPDIPLGARIVAVCDAYDAMRSERPYRERVTPESALAELRRGAGTQFDPGVVEAFCAIAARLPAAAAAAT